MPFTSFSEANAATSSPVWLSTGSERPLAFFAGIHTAWPSARRLAEGEVTANLFGILTCAPDREVEAVHPKAMPVILTTPEDCLTWLTTPTGRALFLQRALPDGELEILPGSPSQPYPHAHRRPPPSGHVTGPLTPSWPPAQPPIRPPPSETALLSPHDPASMILLPHPANGPQKQSEALLTLAPGRMHEAEGPGRRAFALFQAARIIAHIPGEVVWILPGHAPEQLMLPGLPQALGERLLILRPASETDLLWSAEEVLRARPIALMVAEPGRMLTLTAGRRLQLAAEAGRTTGLMLIQEGQGSNATETRWYCAPLPRPESNARTDSTLHAWSLKKNKSGTCGDLVIDWNGASSAFNLVSLPGERSRFTLA